MLGLYGQSHLELEEFIDLTVFDNIQLDIWTGIATAKPIVNNGYLIDQPVYKKEDLSKEQVYKPLMTAYQEYRKLPDSDPLKIKGDEIENEYGYNALATFLKYAYGAHDHGSHYLFWDHSPGWRTRDISRNITEAVKHFPSLIAWIDDLISQDVFSKIGRAYLIAMDSNGYSPEHRDPPLDPDLDELTSPEFIHIRPNLKRPFYVYDTENKQKHYIQSRVAWWNDKDMHGGDLCIEPTYAIRLDGMFTDKFKRKINIL